MPREIINIDVCGRNLSINTFGALTGSMLISDITKFITPVLSGVKIGMGEEKTLAGMKVSFDMSNVTQALITHVDSQKVRDLITRILAESKYDGADLSKPSVIDDVFSGEYDALFECIKTVLEVNFKSFLDIIGVSKLIGL